MRFIWPWVLFLLSSVSDSLLLLLHLYFPCCCCDQKQHTRKGNHQYKQQHQVGAEIPEFFRLQKIEKNVRYECLPVCTNVRESSGKVLKIEKTKGTPGKLEIILYLWSPMVRTYHNHHTATHNLSRKCHVSFCHTRYTLSPSLRCLLHSHRVTCSVHII